MLRISARVRAGQGRDLNPKSHAWVISYVIHTLPKGDPGMIRTQHDIRQCKRWAALLSISDASKKHIRCISSRKVGLPLHLPLWFSAASKTNRHVPQRCNGAVFPARRPPSPRAQPWPRAAQRGLPEARATSFQQGACVSSDVFFVWQSLLIPSLNRADICQHLLCLHDNNWFVYSCSGGTCQNAGAAQTGMATAWVANNSLKAEEISHRAPKRVRK